MKTLIKRHLIGLFALVLTVATMSFKMVESSKSDDLVWFEVVGGAIDVDAETSGPGGNCLTPERPIICKAAFLESSLTPEGNAPTTNPYHSSVQDLAYRTDL